MTIGTMMDAISAQLRAELLLPPEAAPPGTELPRSADATSLADRAIGSLVAGAIGDALGRPREGARAPSFSPSDARWLSDFVPIRGWAGPTGVITDDTQLTIEVAETLIQCGHVDPEELSRRLVAWLPNGRGRGQATTEAVYRLMRGEPWHVAGTPSAGNGAAMRVAPIGIARHGDIGRLRVEAAMSALPTHRDTTAMRSAILMAYATAWALTKNPASISRNTAAEELGSSLARVVADLEGERVTDRQPDGSARPVLLEERIGEWLAESSLEPSDVLGRRYSGAFVLESLPAALWCFVHAVDDPARAIEVAANTTRDSDTVAAMTGNLVGALHGYSALPERWTTDVEEHDRLVALAGQLVKMT